ncbi:MAG: LOG family protein [Pirellulaceae bacterium]|nr:LOG family protein [Pirellulaceae bacterium]
MPDYIEENLKEIVKSPSYRLAEYDTAFIKSPELRPMRMHLEMLKPELALVDQDIQDTVVTFGGTQIVERPEALKRLDRAKMQLEKTPKDPRRKREVQRAQRVLDKSGYYDAAKEFANIVSTRCLKETGNEYHIITGGGPGIMEAANRGAFEANKSSIGLNITLPQEQEPNPYITPGLCFQFHYFAVRKMHFLLRAKALVVFPGGFGTLDELFDALTLRQTECMQNIPIILFGRKYWEQVVDFHFMADEGVIADHDLDLIDFAETAEEAWEIIVQYHNEPTEPKEVLKKKTRK